MAVIWVLICSSILVLIFVTLWLRERRRAEVEYIAYGLRGDEDNDENTKTNITAMEASFLEAISKLEELGEVCQDEWGHWIWAKTGRPVGGTSKE